MIILIIVIIIQGPAGVQEGYYLPNLNYVLATVTQSLNFTSFIEACET